MKLRLFSIRDTQTGKTLPDHYASKPEARVERDRLNGSPGHNGCRYVITYGPDHRRGVHPV